MRNLFYGILSFILLLYISFGFFNDRTLEQDRHKGAVVINKDKDFYYGEQMIFLYPNDSTDLELVYQIFYNKYNVGDTIK